MTNEELYYLPASELLKHIQAEKERLIKEKVIKQSKPLPTIIEEEKPYELSEDWEWVRLSDIVANELYSFADGPFGSNLKREHYTEDGVRIIQLQNIGEDGWRGQNKIYTSHEKAKELIRSTANPGEIVIAKMMPVGRAIILPDDEPLYIMSSDCVKLKPHKLINTKYLCYCINSSIVKKQCLDSSSGTTRQRTSLNKLKAVLIPLPPLYIQDQIVQKLEQLSETTESLLSHAKSQLNYTKKMREALLQEAIRGELVTQDENDEPALVLLEKIKAEKERLIKEKVIKKSKPLLTITEEEKPYDLPQGWEWVRLGDVGITQTGTTPSTKVKEYFNGTIPFIKPGDISQKGINYENDSLTECGVNVGRVTGKNSILMVCIGGSIGKTHYTNRLVSFNQQINAIECYSPVQFKYIYYTLISNFFNEQVLLRATGTATPIINKSLWDNIAIPLPPLAEQNRIVAKLDELMAHCDQLELKAEEMKQSTIKLFEASLKEAFMPE